jgi:ABC-type multidrug transport system permease subunit
MDSIIGLIFLLGIGYLLVKLTIKLLPAFWFFSVFVVALIVFLTIRSFLQISGLDIIIMIGVSIMGAWAFAKRKA